MEKELLNSELDNATGYLNRILQVACRYGHLGRHPQLVSDTSDLYLDLVKILEQNFFKIPFEDIDLKEVPIDKKLTPLLNMLQGLTQLPIASEQLAMTITSAINTLYDCAYKVHKVMATLVPIEIEYPRINLIQMNASEGGVVRFELPLQSVQEAIKLETPMECLKTKREELYKHWLHQGHQYLLHEEIDKAHSCFERASSLKKCAEILTLRGWTYSLKEDLEQAKKLCLQAIRLDPDYGPPYNDLGTYLLKEGNAKEALHWFELAKKAKNYQNREYPYINSARAYIAQKRYHNALDEFSYALTLTPYNEELQEAVINIRNKVEQRETVDEHF